MSQMNTYGEYFVDYYHEIIYYVVEPQHELCSRCNTYGHSRESSSCPMYATERNYCIPALKRKCSRCNQPGHARSNRGCSLYQQYPDKYAPEIREIISNNNLFPEDTVQMNKITNIIKSSTILEISCREIITSLSNRTVYPDQNNNLIGRCRIIRNDMINFIPLFNTINVRDKLLTQTTTRTLMRHMDELREILVGLPIELHTRIMVRTSLSPTVKPYPKINIIKSTVIDLTETTNECSICFEEYTVENMCLTNCNHMFCVNCIQTYHKTLHYKTQMSCPMCRTSIVNVTSSSDIIKF